MISRLSIIAIIIFGLLESSCSSTKHLYKIGDQCVLSKDNSLFNLNNNGSNLRDVRKIYGKGSKSRIIYKRGESWNLIFRNWDVVVDYPEFGLKFVTRQLKPWTLNREISAIVLYSDCPCVTQEGIGIGSNFYQLDSVYGGCEVIQRGPEKPTAVQCNLSKNSNFISFHGLASQDSSDFVVTEIVIL
jgi:hypothetical protein